MQTEAQPSSNYSFTVKRQLTRDEYRVLYEKHWPVLQKLCSRYLPNLSLAKGIPVKIEFADALRGSWLLDKDTDRPPYADVVSGVGFAFGLLLEELLGMEWCVIEDLYGEDVSLVKLTDRVGTTYTQISVPPFNYVVKRETTQNVEVFADGLLEFKRMIDT